MAKSSSSNALFWALVLVGAFVLFGNWEKISGWWRSTKLPPEPPASPAPTPEGSRRLPRPGKPRPAQTRPAENPLPETTGFDFEKDARFVRPTGGSVEVVEHSAYTLGYAEKYEQPAWVAYRLLAGMVSGRNKREDNFRPDPEVSTASALPDDYRGSGYDRGHLAPVADFKASARWMDETFFMSNMSPQVHEFNAGIWERLESKTRGWAKKEQAVYVVAGPILQPGLPVIGRRNQVAVPAEYYKVVYDLREPGLKAIGFILRNEASRRPLQSFAVPVDEVERRTGLDFFPLIPDELEKTLESRFDPAPWFEKKGR